MLRAVCYAACQAPTCFVLAGVEAGQILSGPFRGVTAKRRSIQSFGNTGTMLQDSAASNASWFASATGRLESATNVSDIAWQQGAINRAVTECCSDS